MVGVINAPISGNTYDKWVAAAKAIGSNEIPIRDNGPVTGGVGALTTGTPSPIPPTCRPHVDLIVDPPCCEWLFLSAGCSICHNAEVINENPGYRVSRFFFHQVS